MLSAPLESVGKEQLLHLVAGDRIVPHSADIDEPSQQRRRLAALAKDVIGLLTMETLDDDSRAVLAVDLGDDLVHSIEDGLDLG